MAQVTTIETTARVSVYKIKPNPYQPEARLTFPEADVLNMANSLLLHGQIQPCTVRLDSEIGYYQMGDGWLRRAGAIYNQEHGHPEFGEITIIIRTLNNQQMADLIIEANTTRKDLTPIDLAKQYKQYCEEFHVTQTQLAERHHCSQAEISNTVRLLELPDDVQKLLITQVISETHCRYIVQLKDPVQMSLIAHEVAGSGATVAALEARVKQILGKPKKIEPAKQAGQETSLFLQPPSPTPAANTETKTPLTLEKPPEEKPPVQGVEETKAPEGTSPAATPSISVSTNKPAIEEEKPKQLATPPAASHPQSKSTATPSAIKRKMTLNETDASVIVMIGRDGVDPYMKNIRGNLETVAPVISETIAEAETLWQTAPRKPVFAAPVPIKPPTPVAKPQEDKTVTADKPAQELEFLKDKEDEE